MKTIVTLCLVLLTGVSSAWSQEPPKATSSYADPEGAVNAPLPRDIEPVYKELGVDVMATVHKRGALRVGVAISEPTVMHDGKGQLIGFSVDLARQLAEDLGVRLELVETSWARIIPDLIDRRFDLCVSGVWVTPARMLVVNFSTPTSTEGIYLIGNKTLASSMKSIEAFNKPDVRVSVYAGTLQERIAMRVLPRATLIRVEGDDDHLAPVLEGKAHAALVPTFAPDVLVRLAPDKLLLPLAEPLQSTVTAMAVRRGDPDFLTYLNNWLLIHSVQSGDGWLKERAKFWSDPANWAE